MAITFTDLDTDLTYLYKVAIERFEIPVKYLVLHLENSEVDFPLLDRDYSIISFSELVTNYYSAGNDILELHNYLSQYILDQRLDVFTDAAMVIYAYVKDGELTTEDIVNLVNIIYHNPTNPLPPLADITQIDNLYQSWLAMYNLEYEKDYKEYQKIRQIQVQLEEVESAIVYSPFLLTKLGIETIPSITYNGAQLFQSIRLSLQVPFVQYRDVKGEVVYKIYSPPDTKINYAIIEEHHSKAIRDNYLYLTLWVGKDYSKLDVGSLYLLAQYNLELNRLYVEFPNTADFSREEISNILETALNVKLSSFNETRLDGNFNIYNVELIEPIFLDMVTLDPLFSYYIFCDESRNPYYLKKKVVYHIKSTNYLGVTDEKGRYNLATLSFSFYQYYSVAGEKSQVYNPGTNTTDIVSLGGDTPYLTIGITHAISKRAINQLLYLLPRLLYIYQQNVERINKEYEQVLGISLLPSESTIRKARIRYTQPGSKIQQIKALASDLFVPDYARICQCGSQPIIISPDEVEYWKSQYVRGQERQIMSFPKDTPTWLFVCPDNERPYPGVKRNKILSNSNIYPYVPCCYRNDQMDPKANSLYNEYYRGIPKKEKTKTTIAHKIVTDKILQVGRLGNLPTLFNRLLTLSEAIQGEIARYGVAHTPNSLIHCLLHATDDNFRNLSEAEQEIYAIELRRKLGEYIHPALLKQELFDQGLEEIREYLTNPSLDFDSTLLYRALEEYFEVNLLVLRRDTGNQLQLELPRYKYFPLRNFHTNRLSVIVYRHWGAETDNLTSPHYELVVEHFPTYESNNINYILSPSVGYYLYQTLILVNRIVKWNYTDSVRDYEIILSNDFYNTFSDLIVGQYIDSIGKVRAYVLVLDNVLFTVIIPPSCPENIPLVELDDLPLISYDNAKVIFSGYPLIAKDNYNNKIVGLWYRLGDIPVYLPLQPESDDKAKLIDAELANIPIGDLNPLYVPSDNRESLVLRISMLRDTLSILLRIVLWLYTYWLVEYPASSPREFIDSTSFVGQDELNKIVDTLTIYDFSSIPSEVPELSNYKEAITYISNYNTGLTINYNNDIFLYFYSQKLADGVTYFLISTFKDNANVQVLHLRGLLDNYTANPYEIFLKSEEELAIWLKLSRRNISEIVTKLTIERSTLTEPYFYLEDEHLYLVQNIKPAVDYETVLKRALLINYYWIYYNRNLGYDPERWLLEQNSNIDVNNYNYITYTISAAGTLHSDSEVNISENVVEILDYQNGNVAVLLSM